MLEKYFEGWYYVGNPPFFGVGSDNSLNEGGA